MYQLSDFGEHDILLPNRETSSFIKVIKSKWEDIYNNLHVFRYKLNNLEERTIGGKYILLLNPDRSMNRRQPEHIDDIHQPFDEHRFNFTKVSLDEILFSINYKGDEHSLVVNVSPISYYHTLLCPFVKKKLPQVATKDSLSLVLEVMFLAQDRDLKVAFNSLCAFASVNHLHYHLLLVKHTLPVELAKWKQIRGPLHCTQDYVVPAFCFEVEKTRLDESAAEIYKLIKYLLANNIAHNILVTMRNMNVAVYLFPRKGTAGVKQLKAFNAAAFELSGWMIMHSPETFHTLQPEDLETELKKWKINNFDTLCREFALLY